MADIGPAQWPTTPSFRAVNFRHISPAITTETMSGKIRRVGMGHTYYTFDVEYPTLTYDQMLTVQTWIALTRGPLYSFEIVLPEISISDAADATTANATVTVSGNVAAGSTTALLSNCGSNKTVMMAGDVFRFHNHTKVYTTTSAVTSNAAGYATVNFAGGTVSSVSSGGRVWVQNVPFTAIMADSTQEIMVGTGGLSEIKIAMREVWA